ncbi:MULTISPECIES: Holliday junction branch migration protein RuvA [unclassified Methylophaga]|jgi:Holliday junction DNA helicase RuvA|uniref:Holliday junction branch migration protein RuvA n=1 Tax=unclassified Methylophaga TaxID=2629249 RepID=UPI000C5E99B8|nr:MULTISPECIES: Holliday junction branch migration protein RuvA [unclassified Methylophaga]MAX50807.1 Holliday junction branch migration protein RuvA [Methylophaga sp.]|tara:strand:- start:8910 stop:9506 length:597 start_codon:yes stop_codon:yes gene_type:complete
MIGRLRGIIIEKQPPELVLDVHGVGYELSAPMSTFFNLPAVNEEVMLFTHMVVREDAQLLYAFATERERLLFRSLLKVNGVGAKLALTILSGSDVDAFARSVQEGDTASLTRLPGVGKKTAERLIVEMRDRLKEVSSAMGIDTIVSDMPMTTAGAKSEAVEALVALGYKPNEADKMLRSFDSEGMTTEQIIRQALQRN